MAFRIFPEDERVIELLVQMSQCVTTSVDLLAEHLSATDERVAETMQSLLDTEDECSSLYFSLMTTTRSSYVVPIPRQDLYILGQWIQKALEALVACAETQQLYKIDRPTSHATEQLNIIRLMSEMTTKAMGRLATLDELDDYWFEMIRLSRQSERTHRTYRASLLDKHKALQALRRMDAAGRLLDASRALAHVSAEVGRVLVSES
ncbi:hypothetical protein [Kocuria atrinae]|uniref:Phosphate transport regulator n=1 Tax=Kocuria atrinae TaxID=592377 RepID=A0ABN2XHK3_9MICC